MKEGFTKTETSKCPTCNKPIYTIERDVGWFSDELPIPNSTEYSCHCALNHYIQSLHGEWQYPGIRVPCAQCGRETCIYTKTPKKRIYHCDACDFHKEYKNEEDC